MLLRLKACLLLVLVSGGIAGCAGKWPNLDLNQLRDPRAVDIESRMAGPPADFRPREVQ